MARQEVDGLLSPQLDRNGTVDPVDLAQAQRGERVVVDVAVANSLAESASLAILLGG